jgi:hypothetical protein
MTTEVGSYVSKQLQIWKIPLDKWPGEVKDFGNECRRMGQIFGRGSQEIQLAFGMRRLVALCGRTLEQADWQKEVEDRTRVGTPKYGYADGVISTHAYRDIRSWEISRIVGAAMPDLIRRAGDLQEYLDKRWWATPRGTSSFGGLVKSELKELEHPMLDLQMRPIKPTVQESLSERDLLGWLATPPRARARGSTKPEPGMKRRALLAVDDVTAFIAGYASQHVETITKYAGMVLRQDPADVSEWVNFDVGPDVWRVSNDYSNFNILNSLRSMQLIDLAFADAWAKCPLRFAQQKRYASLWVAMSYNDMVMSTPLGESRVKNGLWSGHRNTARDNTMLHVVYLSCIKSIQQALFGAVADTCKQRICGDDETLSYNTWAPAVCHTLVADAAGFTSQVSKGLLSRKHDEFLQLMRTPGAPPQYPVCATMLTFCSGNWYKDAVRDIPSTVKDISDHAWDMVLGGLNIGIARELAAYVCDYMMQVQNGEHRLEALEWWQYRGCNLPEGHPLWGVVTEAPPTVADTWELSGVPAEAVQQSLRREEKFWADIPPMVRDRVMHQRLCEAYRPVAKKALTREHDEQVLKVWPRRQTKWTPKPPPEWSGPPPVPTNRWRAIPMRAMERSARAVAIKVGFPPELLGTEYMWWALTKLTPRDRAVMIQGLQEKQKPTKGWRWWLPPLLRVA